MRDSDLDVMAVIKDFWVCEDKHIFLNADKILLSTKMEDTNARFTMLRVVHCNKQRIFECCNQLGSDFYLSSLAFKQSSICSSYSVIHGPCVSDEYGKINLTVCLHSKLWITSAKQ